MSYFLNKRLVALNEFTGVEKPRAIAPGDLADNTVVTGAILKQWINQHAAALEPQFAMLPRRAALAFLIELGLPGKVGGPQPEAASVPPGYAFMDTTDNDLIEISDGASWIALSGANAAKFLELVQLPLYNRVASKAGSVDLAALAAALSGGAAPGTTLKSLADALALKLNANAPAVNSNQLGGFDPAHFLALANATGLLPASKVSGVFDPSNIPPSVRAMPQFCDGDITALTTGQQNSIGEGSAVLLADGRVLYYKGTGSKTSEASYVIGADKSPAVEQIPALPISKTTGLQEALDGKEPVRSGTGLRRVDGSHTAIAAADVPLLASDKIIGLRNTMVWADDYGFRPNATAAANAAAWAAMAAYVKTLSDGATVYPGHGTFLTNASLEWTDRMHIVGAGKGSCVFKAANGANIDVIKSTNFDNLWDTNSDGGISRCSIRDLCIDGNSANNSAGRGLCVYGFAFRIADVEIRFTKGNGLYTDYGTLEPQTGPNNFDIVESVMQNVIVHQCDAPGIIWRGPHDSKWFNVLSCLNLGAANIIVGGNGGALIAFDVHTYVNATRQAERGIILEAGFNQFFGCAIEGGPLGQVWVKSSENRFDGRLFYNRPGFTNDSDGFLLGDTTTRTFTATTANGRDTLTAVSSVVGLAVYHPITGAGIPSGTYIEAITRNPSTNAYTITMSANATASATVTVTRGVIFASAQELRGKYNNIGGGVVKVQASGGLNVVDLSGYSEFAPASLMATVAFTDRVYIHEQNHAQSVNFTPVAPVFGAPINVQKRITIGEGVNDQYPSPAITVLGSAHATSNYAEINFVGWRFIVDPAGAGFNNLLLLTGSTPVLNIEPTSGKIKLDSLPTVGTGHNPNTVWRDAGTLKITS